MEGKFKNKLKKITNKRFSWVWKRESRVDYLYLTPKVIIFIIFALFVPDPLSAEVFNIPSGNINALINAIDEANSNGEDDTIKLKPGIYTLTAIDNNTDGANGLPSITSKIRIANGLPSFTRKIRINVAGANATIIERDQNAPPFRIFHVAPTGTLTVDGIAIRGGFIECCDIGGGIFNNGQLTITNSIISDNVAVFEGGGIAGDGAIIITNSTISFNSAQDGGGIFSNGPVTITNSDISENSAEGFGGGIWGGGPLAIFDSTIAHNTIEAFGGGIAGGEVNIINSKIIGNSSGFRGGGISFFSGTNRTSTITNTTISNNSADGGAAIANSSESTVIITNSTVSDNSSVFAIAGITNTEGIVNIINSTVANNNGFGIETSGGMVSIINSTVANNEFGIVNSAAEELFGIVEMQNTILALNHGGNCFGPVTSLGNNLTTDIPRFCDFANAPNDIFGDPGLRDFTDDGTPGNGHFPLLLSSQAIDAGNNDVCLDDPILATDQIGNPRFGICDIGSIEFKPCKNRGRYISKLIKQNCSGLKGKARAACKHQQQQFCSSLF